MTNDNNAHALRPTAFAVVALSALLLSACGGGGSAGDAPGAAAPAPLTLSGVTATGAPLAGASIRVTDSAGNTVCTSTAGSDGSYRCTLPETARLPFALSAQLEDQTLYGVATAAGTANVTPLTTLIVARIAPGGDPSRLADAILADPAVASVAKVQEQVDEVKAMLAPVLAATGDSTDPIRGSFSADGSGHDRLLDTLQVSIRPEGAASNIEITVKTRPADDAAEPMKLSFKSSDNAPAPLAAPIRAGDLVDTGVAGQVNGFVGRATACYAKPLAIRIAGVADGATQATGDASSVQAPECRGLFVDNDPALYKDNGAVVSSTGAFSAMFKDSATGTKFDRATYEYQWANGDIYVTFRSTSASGAEGWNALTLRRQDGVLRAVGNQYAYDATVRAVAIDREFPRQPQFSWLGSGYGPAIRNMVDPGTGLPLFREASVTAPDGRRTLYRPLAGNLLMGIVSPDGRQRTNVNQLLGSAFQDPATPGVPADKDGNGGAYFVAPQLDDAALRALPDQGVWTIEWVHVDAGRANVVQRYRTISRAPTLAEMRQMKVAQLTDAFRAELLARSDVAIGAGITFGAPDATVPNVFSFATASGADGWQVPEGAIAPRTLYLNGVLGAAPFSNSATVPSTSRSGMVTCSTASIADLHCDSSTGVRQFAQGARITNFELDVTTPRQVGLYKQISLYTLAP